MNATISKPSYLLNLLKWVDCFEHVTFWDVMHTFSVELSVWRAALICCLCSHVSRRKCNLFYKAFWCLVVWCDSQDEDVCVQYILSKFAKIVSRFSSRYSSSLCTGFVSLKFTRVEDLNRVWGGSGSSSDEQSSETCPETTPLGFSFLSSCSFPVVCF